MTNRFGRVIDLLPHPHGRPAPRRQSGGVSQEDPGATPAHPCRSGQAAQGRPLRLSSSASCWPRCSSSACSSAPCCSSRWPPSSSASSCCACSVSSLFAGALHLRTSAHRSRPSGWKCRPKCKGVGRAWRRDLGRWGQESKPQDGAKKGQPKNNSTKTTRGGRGDCRSQDVGSSRIHLMGRTRGYVAVVMLAACLSWPCAAGTVRCLPRRRVRHAPAKGAAHGPRQPIDHIVISELAGRGAKQPRFMPADQLHRAVSNPTTAAQSISAAGHRTGPSHAIHPTTPKLTAVPPAPPVTSGSGRAALSRSAGPTYDADPSSTTHRHQMWCRRLDIGLADDGGIGFRSGSLPTDPIVDQVGHVRCHALP